MAGCGRKCNRSSSERDNKGRHRGRHAQGGSGHQRLGCPHWPPPAATFARGRAKASWVGKNPKARQPAPLWPKLCGPATAPGQGSSRRPPPLGPNLAQGRVAPAHHRPPQPRVGRWFAAIGLHDPALAAFANRPRPAPLRPKARVQPIRSATWYRIGWYTRHQHEWSEERRHWKCRELTFRPWIPSGHREGDESGGVHREKATAARQDFAI
jgi:hypothetical protein